MLTLTIGVLQRFHSGTLDIYYYINDITQSGEPFDFIIYTDDTTLLITLEFAMKVPKLKLHKRYLPYSTEFKAENFTFCHKLGRKT